jgi:hypothetical protein
LRRGAASEISAGQCDAGKAKEEGCGKCLHVVRY